eukprot:IDg14378t1
MLQYNETFFSAERMILEHVWRLMSSSVYSSVAALISARLLISNPAYAHFMNDSDLLDGMSEFLLVFLAISQKNYILLFKTSVRKAWSLLLRCLLCSAKKPTGRIAHGSLAEPTRGDRKLTIKQQRWRNESLKGMRTDRRRRRTTKCSGIRQLIRKRTCED